MKMTPAKIARGNDEELDLLAKRFLMGEAPLRVNDDGCALNTGKTRTFCGATQFKKYCFPSKRVECRACMSEIERRAGIHSEEVVR